MHTFVVNEASDWYASSQSDEVRLIYAKWEPTRALFGELALPAGAYAVRLFLTEESFHESAGSPPSGSWATVMTHDEVRFVIAAPVPALSTRGLALLALGMVWAGAMLTMIAETMLPEAFEQGGAIVGLSTLGGFLAALTVKVL
jgi:hypothetical protein